MQAFLPVHIGQALLGFTALSFDPGTEFMQAVAERLLQADQITHAAVWAPADLLASVCLC